jgi:hypothetical protein
MKVRSLAFLGLSLLSTVCAGLAHAANSTGLAYRYTTNVSLYGRSTGMLITGRCNRYASAFKTARAKGAEVLAYLDVVDRPDNKICDLDKGFYMNNYGAVPLWPYPSYGQRGIWPGYKMTDMRPGSKWILHVVSYVEKLMRERKVDGVFLDVVGGRPWNQLANWTKWSKKEKDTWTAGCVDLVRRLDAKRRAINPNFIIVNNNVWDRGDGYSAGYAGEKYVDGVSIEHPVRGVKAYHRNYAGKKFGNLGHRRVIVIARDAAEARAWAKVSGVTHVAGQSHYRNPPAPAVGFKALNDR